MEALQVDERVETITTRGVKLIAATLSESRAELLTRAAIVAGLLPLPAERRTFQFRDSGSRSWHSLSGAIATDRVYVGTKSNLFVSRAKRLPALASSGTLTTGTDENGWWFVVVSTSAGECRCTEPPHVPKRKPRVSVYQQFAAAARSIGI